MSIISDYPVVPGPGPAGGRAGRQASVAGSIVAAAAILIGSTLLGLAGGLVWASLAPRAVYVVIGHGSANVVDPETSAFIAADAWYCLIGAAGGLIIGLA